MAKRKRPVSRAAPPPAAPPLPSTPFLVGMAVVWVAAGAGVALWAWGDWRAFLASPARWGTLLSFAVYTFGAAFSRTSGWSSGRREDERNRWIVVPLLALGAVLGVLPPYSDHRGLWVLDGDAVRYTGLALSWFGTAMRLAAMFVLRHRFSSLVAIQQGHKLVTSGIYGVVRHPGYLGGLAMMLGWALTFRSLGGVAAFLGMLALLIVRMNAEEALLASEFGEEYAAYRRRTRRLIPFLY